jgi:hypothetical protein
MADSDLNEAVTKWLEADRMVEKAKALKEQAEAVLLEDVEHVDFDCPRCGHIFKINIYAGYHVCPECLLGIG